MASNAITQNNVSIIWKIHAALDKYLWRISIEKHEKLSKKIKEVEDKLKGKEKDWE